MHLVQDIHKTGREKGEQEFGMNLEDYLSFRLEGHVLWELGSCHDQDVLKCVLIFLDEIGYKEF